MQTDPVIPPQHPRKSLPEKARALIEKIAAAALALISKINMPEIQTWVKNYIAGLKPQPGVDKKVLVRRYLILAGVVLALFGVIFAFKSCAASKRSKQNLKDMVMKQGGAKDDMVPVKGFKVGRFNFEDSLNALGTIKGAMEFKLSFEIPGVISSINYREGERYEEGALLMSLRQDDILLRLKRAQAQLNKAETQVQLCKEKEKEHAKLFEIGAIPKTTLDKVKLETESAQFEAEAARLEAKANEAMLEKSNLYAPSAGMIGELSVEEGENVTSNTMLGTHVMTEYVYAEFGVVERDVNKIALGQKAKIFVDAYPDKNFEGVIENVAPVVAGSSRTATVKVRIENPERLLLPGMFARVRILLYSKKNTLVVPTDAVQGSQGEQFVYVYHPDKETVEKRAVAIGYTRPDYSQVDAGLSEGEIVAVSGLDKLEDGKKARLLETQEAEI